MKLRSTLLLSPLLLLSCSKEEPKPNFVVILIDDLGWADVACNNAATFYETPRLDQMARDGVRFSNAYSAHPVCSPTRAALMTGKHPNRVGITDWLPGDDPKNRPLLGPEDRMELALEEVTLAEKLKENGYATCFVGKWHLGHDEIYWPENQGFDINIGGWEAGQPRIKQGVSNGYYSPYGNPRLKDGPEGEYLTDRLTNESLAFLGENKDKPFLLYLSYYTVHTPIQPAERHIDKFKEKRKGLGLEDEIPHRPEGEGFSKLVQENAEYASMVAAMDENVGRILDGLKQNGLDKNTWVIFTSDNGGLSTLRRMNAPTSNVPLRAGKGWCYEGGIRVPFIVNGPGIVNQGRSADQPVVSMDIFATVLDLAGISAGSGDGKSLLPVLRETGDIGRDALFWHYPHYHGSGWKPGSALRKGNWKFIHNYEDNSTELYDLETDPSETTNLADVRPEMVLELKQILEQKISESGGKYPGPNPEYLAK
jgi:arylsulfatase A-like enzyme